VIYDFMTLIAGAFAGSAARGFPRVGREIRPGDLNTRGLNNNGVRGGGYLNPIWSPSVRDTPGGNRNLGGASGSKRHWGW